MTTTADHQPAQTLPAIVWVPSADDMDLDIFCLHMTHRHSDSLGGLEELDPDILERTGLEELYRTFHDKLHNRTLYPFKVFDHRHRKPRS